MVISARESIFSSGPKCVQSRTFVCFDIMLGKMFIVHVYTVCAVCVYGSLSSVPVYSIAHSTPTNHKSFYSLLTLRAREGREGENMHNNRWRKQKSKNQLETCARARERERERQTVSQLIRFDNQFHVETNVHTRFWSHERIKEICWNVAHAIRGAGKI